MFTAYISSPVNRVMLVSTALPSHINIMGNSAVAAISYSGEQYCQYCSSVYSQNGASKTSGSIKPFPMPYSKFRVQSSPRHTLGLTERQKKSSYPLPKKKKTPADFSQKLEAERTKRGDRQRHSERDKSGLLADEPASYHIFAHEGG